VTLRLRALLGSIAAFVAGWYLGRDHEWRLWQEACETPLPDPMDAVQPSDPWPPVQMNWWHPYLGSDPVLRAENEAARLDPTYNEAYTHAVIRRSAQSADRPTEGMS
jgi:hypothetical protein